MLSSVRILPPEEERALAERLVGLWGSDSAPGVRLRLLANGTFEEIRERPLAPGPSQVRGGVFEVCGREVRLRFDDGESRAFLVDEEPAPGVFVSAGETWRRIAEAPPAGGR